MTNAPRPAAQSRQDLRVEALSTELRGGRRVPSPPKGDVFERTKGRKAHRGVLEAKNFLNGSWIPEMECEVFRKSCF